MKKVLFTGDTLSDEKRENLRKRGFEFVPARIDLTEEELISTLKGFDGYILGGEEIATKNVIENAKSLKVITFFGTGFEKYIDVSAAKKCGVVVTNTPNTNTNSVAEFTIALILSTVKEIVPMNNKTKNGMWEKAHTWDLRGKTVGIIGMGNIGSLVAKILHNGFGMKINYYSRNRKLEIEKELHANFLPLDEIFKSSDVVSIHLAYSEETIGIINSSHLKNMKHGATLVNTARAELVDPASLKEILSENGPTVAFDCYYKEPVPHPNEDLWGLLSVEDKKFILTPHSAYNTADAVEKMEEMAVENTIKILKGEQCNNTIRM